MERRLASSKGKGRPMTVRETARLMEESVIEARAAGWKLEPGTSLRDGKCCPIGAMFLRTRGDHPYWGLVQTAQELFGLSVDYWRGVVDGFDNLTPQGRITGIRSEYSSGCRAGRKMRKYIE